MSRAAFAESETARPAGEYHKFDLSGLGPAPYAFLGMEEKVCAGPCMSGYSSGYAGQPAGTCDFCGNGIKYCFRFRAANGHEFIVGSDCAMTAGDSGMRKVVKDHVAKERRAQNERRAAAKYERAIGRIYRTWSKLDEVAPLLAAQPHPRRFTDRETGKPMTLLDWAYWMMANAGMSGRLQVCDAIDKIVGGAL